MNSACNNQSLSLVKDFRPSLSFTNENVGFGQTETIHLNHDFYVIVGKQCCTENALTQYLNIYMILTNILLLFICLKLVFNILNENK